MSNYTGIYFEFHYYNESGFDTPELILRRSSYEVDIGYIAELKEAFLEAIENQEIGLKDDEFYLITFSQYDEGTPTNPDIHYEVTMCYQLVDVLGGNQ